jgi:FMN phosphatase YigB (HAD superfamily)
LNFPIDGKIQLIRVAQFRLTIANTLNMSFSADKENRPDFSTLIGIMERFNGVPYDQFQEELDRWFTKEMEANGTANPELLSKLKELSSSIYHEAELRALLNDAEIGGDCE